MNAICLNGRIYAADEPLFTAQNRGFRYGDGVFETIKVYAGHILLAAFHFDRLFLSLRLLKMEVPSSLNRQELSDQVLQLCRRNHCLDRARVRLAVYRGDDNVANYVLEAFPLAAESSRLNEQGWTLELFPYARKSCDALGNLKTANYLPFVLADLYAREKGVDECLLLNVENRICEASKANIFLVRNNEVHTPALHQGCVNGVMRRFLIERLKQNNIVVHQHELTEDLLKEAEEVFLTNAINGIRWVQRYHQSTYTRHFIQQIHSWCFPSFPEGPQ
ncbi:aminotransferase class IV [Paraflavisolibacter sp. H34]|uniref:aminotransferase class IV n=1 Tax=Huijunlia imazamoxiresistens TaxID=3127457 RepID=UPI00301ADF1B